jgi:hypothetical protein
MQTSHASSPQAFVPSPVALREAKLRIALT